MHPPSHGHTWIQLTADPLSVDAASRWAGRPDCGAIVSFTGTARDHSDGREGVYRLEYEAYSEQALPRMQAVADEARSRWSSVGRLVLLHRVGSIGIGDAAVVVVAGAPHRDDAFAAARYCIDALKATVPIWKREAWSAGESWGLEAQHLTEVDQLEVHDDGRVAAAGGQANSHG